VSTANNNHGTKILAFVKKYINLAKTAPKMRRVPWSPEPIPGTTVDLDPFNRFRSAQPRDRPTLPVHD